MGLQHWIPQHSISRLMGKLGSCRWCWWKNWAIRYFIKRYQVNLSIAEIEDVKNYPHFNAFFTRYLKPTVRPIVQGPNQIACPVDGCISQIGKIRNDLLLQAKGSYFNLSALLGGAEKHTRYFFDGLFATVYLAPKDYHRVHMPLRGQLIETIYIPGKLFSVNPQTVKAVPQLFTRNERLVCIFETAIGPMALILVGAIIVSSINTIWPMQPSHTIEKKNYSAENITIEQGAEMGHFTLGSTVIILFAKDALTWADETQVGAKVKMGQLLATIESSHKHSSKD